MQSMYSVALGSLDSSDLYFRCSSSVSHQTNAIVLGGIKATGCGRRRGKVLLQVSRCENPGFGVSHAVGWVRPT
jgi:hypothetical protein